MFKNPMLRDFATGLFALGALLGLALTLMLVGELTGFGESYYRFKVRLASGAGLASTSPVTFNGVKVGKVVRADVVEPPGVGAEIEVEVRTKAKIPRSAVLSIDKGLLGDAAMEFSTTPGLSAAQVADVIGEGDVFEGGSPETLLAKIEGIVAKPLAKLSTTAENIDKLAAEYTRLGQRLNELVEPRTPEQVDAGAAPNLRSAMARLDAALAGADAWLNDEEMRRDFAALAAKGNATLEDVSKLSAAWTATAAKADGALTQVSAATEDVRTRVREFAARAETTMQAADAAAAEFSGVMRDVREGKGTLGQLAQNPDLYNSLRSAGQRLDAALLELQLLLQKYKAEGIPIKF